MTSTQTKHTFNKYCSQRLHQDILISILLWQLYNTISIINSWYQWLSWFHSWPKMQAICSLSQMFRSVSYMPRSILIICFCKCLTISPKWSTNRSQQMIYQNHGWLKKFFWWMWVVVQAFWPSKSSEKFF